MATMQVSEVVEQPRPASLYIGDLDPRVTTADLLLAFSGAGGMFVMGFLDCEMGSRWIEMENSFDPVCFLLQVLVNDKDFRFYCNCWYFFMYDFWNGALICEYGLSSTAAKAMSSLNHTVLKGKATRIIWCERNPVTRMTGVANLFVKNLDPPIDSAQLKAIFEKFGTIRSCKVAAENGKSKGFGFVQFEKEDSAMAALNAMHEPVLSGKKLYVAQFMRKSQRIAASGQKFTDLYVMNLNEDLTEDCLLKKFSMFGTLHNAVVMRDRVGKSNDFGFVRFEYPEEAREAVEALNGTLLGSKQLCVGRAQKKAERKELSQRARAPNVYVKNLDPAVNEEIGCIFQFRWRSDFEERSTLLGRRLYVGIPLSKEDSRIALQGCVSRTAPSIQDLVRISRPRASAEKPQVDRVHPKAQIQEILPEDELKRLIISLGSC
ncbi:Polyadenylate-binding protein 6-like protein [Drosera capensis]